MRVWVLLTVDVKSTSLDRFEEAVREYPPRLARSWPNFSRNGLYIQERGSGQVPEAVSNNNTFPESPRARQSPYIKEPTFCIIVKPAKAITPFEVFSYSIWRTIPFPTYDDVNIPRHDRRTGKHEVSKHAPEEVSGLIALHQGTQK